MSFELLFQALNDRALARKVQPVMGHDVCRFCRKPRLPHELTAAKWCIEGHRNRATDTHCAQGHPWAERDNRYVRPGNGRIQCRKCRRIAREKRRQP